MKRKSIREVAEEIGVSKQAIFYRMKRPPLSDMLQSHLSKESSVLTVSFDGERMVKQAFCNKATVKRPPKGKDILITSFDGEKLIKQTFCNKAAVKRPSKENIPFDGRAMAMLFDVVDTFKEQLIAKDKQIAELTAVIKIQAMSAIRKPKRKRIKLGKSAETSAPVRRLINSKS